MNTINSLMFVYCMRGVIDGFSLCKSMLYFVIETLHWWVCQILYTQQPCLVIDCFYDIE